MERDQKPALSVAAREGLQASEEGGRERDGRGGEGRGVKGRGRRQSSGGALLEIGG